MPQIFGGSLSPRLDLMMQLATVGPVLPSAVLNTYGTALLLKSPRVNGGIVPMALRAVSSLVLGNVTLRISPTWSDGSVGAGLIITPFTALNTFYTTAPLITPASGIPIAPSPPNDQVRFCEDSSIDLTNFWKHGLTLQQLAFDCQSDQNVDTASITVTYFGLYT